MDPVHRSTPVRRLQSAVEAGDAEAVLAIVQEFRQELFHRAPEMLLVALEQLPAGVVDGDPKLRLDLVNIARNLRGDEHAVIYRNSVPLPVPVDAVDRLAVLTGQIAAARSDGRAEESTRLVAVAHELLRAQPVETHPELAKALPEFHHQWGLTLERAGDLDGALLDYLDSFDWAVSIGHRMMQATSSGAIAYLHALHGRIVTARKWLDRQPDPDPDDWWTESVALQARLAASLIRSSELADATPDPLDGIDAEAASKHWAPYFFVRTVCVDGPRAARVLRTELDTYIASLPAGPRNDAVSAEYVALARLLLAGRAEDLGDVESDDMPTATASLLRQLAAACSAVVQARQGRHRSALQLAAPLLRVDGSRPRVRVIALLATALASRDPAQRSATVAEAVDVARTHGYYSALRLLSGDLRAEAVAHLRSLGAADIGERLGVEDETPLAVLTRRERTVVEHAVVGASVSAIATTLGVSVNTVKSQLRTAYRKLGVTSRDELLQIHHRL